MVAEKVKKLEPVKRDAWENIITGLGTSRDKRTGGRSKIAMPTVTREYYDNIFASDDIAATIAELPAREMVREWITLHIDDSAEDERGGEMEDRMVVAKKALEKMNDLGAKEAMFEAETWSRVFGGSLLFLGVDDGQQDLSEPLNENAIRSFDFIKVFDRFEVANLEYDQNPASPTFGEPTLYNLQPIGSRGWGPQGVTTIHASRFIRIDGVLTSRRRKSFNNGWSDSVYTRLEEVLRDYGIAWGSVAHLIQDFAQAVIKMQGLAAAISSDNDGYVLDRLQAMDMCRSVSRAIPLDTEEEDFMRVQTPIAGLPELMDRFAYRLAAAARMPVTLLMGMSPSGLNATGESDITLFYDQIKAQQEAKHRKPITRLLELVFASADGPPEPKHWSIEFNPLWQMSDKEEAEIRKMQADTDSLYIDRGVLSEKEVAMSRFGGDAYSTDTVLDMEMREEEDELDDAAQNEPPPPPVPTDGDE